MYMPLTKLPQETPHYDLVQSTSARVLVILECSAILGNILQAFYTTSLLNVVGEIPSSTEFHDKVYPMFCALARNIVNI